MGSSSMTVFWPSAGGDVLPDPRTPCQADGHHRATRSGGPGSTGGRNGARVRAVGIGDQEERVAVVRVLVPHIREARTVRRPGNAVLLFGAVRNVAEVPSVGVDDVHVAHIAHTPRQEREPPTVRRPCGLRARRCSVRPRGERMSSTPAAPMFGATSWALDPSISMTHSSPAVRRNRASAGRRSDGRPVTRPIAPPDVRPAEPHGARVVDRADDDLLPFQSLADRPSRDRDVTVLSGDQVMGPVSASPSITRDSRAAVSRHHEHVVREVRPPRPTRRQSASRPERRLRRSALELRPGGQPDQPEPSGFDANRSPFASKAIRPGFASPNCRRGLAR